MQSVGEKLRKARLEKKASLEEVYKQTRIYPNVLEALEQDRAHNFLSSIYIKGFLKTYAQYLGLDGEKLVKEYTDSQKVEAPLSEVVLEKKEKISTQISPFLILRIALTVILGVAFIFYFWYVLKNISTSGKRVQIPEVKVKVALEPFVEAKELVLEVRAKEDCWIRINADNQAVFEKTLPKGKIERWQAKQRLELRIGKPEALEVFLNGKPIDLKKAKVKRSLVITHEGIEGK